MEKNKFCTNCGSELLRTAKFCEECGTQLIVSETVEEAVEETDEIEKRPSYETNNSTKKENPIFLKEDPTKTKKKKKWYKSGVFIACMIAMFVPIANQIIDCEGMCPTLGFKGLTEIISLPIFILIVVGIYRLIRILFKSIKNK